MTELLPRPQAERLIFNYDVTNRNKGILLVDLGQVTPKSEAVGLNPTSLQALFHRVNTYGSNYYADIAEIRHNPQGLSIEPKGFVNKNKKNTQEFDAFGFSLVNVNQIFDMFDAMEAMKIPIFADDRIDSEKIVVVGGASTINPVPLGMFADAVVLGQGEDALLKITKVIEREDIKKSEKLELISKIQGVYVPTAQEEIVDFAEIDYRDDQYIPGSVIVIDGKGSLVISRSCPHNCNFCRLSSSEKYQKKSFEKLVSHIDLLRANGAKEVAIVSASASTYKDNGKTVNDIIDVIIERGMTPKHLADRPEQKGYTSQQSVVLAPENSPRVRREIFGKTIKEEDLRHAIDEAVKAKVKNITFYGITGVLDFGGMVGETKKDLLYFKELADYTNIKAKQSGLNILIEFSMMPLIPSPHTDLETYPTTSWENFQNNLKLLNESVAGETQNNTKFITHLKELDFMLETMLNRGAENEARYCYETYQLAKTKNISLELALKEVLLANIEGAGFKKYLEAVPKDKLPYEGKIKPLRRRSQIRKPDLNN